MADLRLVEDWASLDDVLMPFLVRCGAAALCGAIVGLERELKRKPAGLRTNILICSRVSDVHDRGTADPQGPGQRRVREQFK